MNFDTGSLTQTPINLFGFLHCWIKTELESPCRSIMTYFTIASLLAFMMGKYQVEVRLYQVV